MLLAHATAAYGVHLEDDWAITGPIDLDGLLADLVAQASTAIVFGNEHAARGGTFERSGEVVRVPDTTVPLLRLTGASWAKHYLPFCPHLHDTARWAPTVARALATEDDSRCPEERVREHLIAEAATARHNVLWTRDVVARDIGRRWLELGRRHKAVTRDHARVVPATLPPSVRHRLGSARSRLLADRAAAVLPGRGRPAPAGWPAYLERGAGALVWDVDGNGYVDFGCADGTAALGHGHPAVVNAVREQATRGLRLAPPSPAELTVAELVAAAVPGAEAVRLVPAGIDSVTLAVSLARLRVAGGAVLYGGATTGDGGPDRLSLDSGADERRFLERLSGHGPVAVVLATPHHRVLCREFLAETRRLCDERSGLLVLDEIVTGFRLAAGGLGEWAGVRPDLVGLGTTMAGGAAVAAVAGRADVVGAPTADDRTPVDRLSLEIAKAVLRQYATGDHYRRLAESGRRLRDGVNAHAAKLGHGPVIVGYDPMPYLRLPSDTAPRFTAAMAARGVLMRDGLNFVSAAHSGEQLDFAVAAAGAVLPDVLGVAAR